jgi:hypothetical protein
MNDLLRVLWQRPEAAFNHLRSYGELASVETDLLWQAWRRRTALLLVAAALGCVALLFTGMVVMAAALTGATWTPHQWMGGCAPAALCAMGAAACLAARSRSAMPEAWPALKAQWQLDTQTLNPQTPTAS